MRDKKKGNRILICGIALSICLFVLAGGVILHLSETFIRSGIADMAGAVGIAAPEQLGGVMHLYKSGDGLRDAGEEILRQYGYGRDVYSFVPAWFGAAAYAIPFCITLIMIFSFRLYWQKKVREDEKRTARFVCAIAAAFPDGSSEVVRGVMEGIIGYESAGENGFGYDPIFFLPEYGCTSAQLAPEKKNELSHRGEGLRKMRAILERK